jgi:hypothetical protein
MNLEKASEGLEQGFAGFLEANGVAMARVVRASSVSQRRGRAVGEHGAHVRVWRDVRAGRARQKVLAARARELWGNGLRALRRWGKDVVEEMMHAPDFAESYPLSSTYVSIHAQNAGASWLECMPDVPDFLHRLVLHAVPLERGLEGRAARKFHDSFIVNKVAAFRRDPQELPKFGPEHEREAVDHWRREVFRDAAIKMASHDFALFWMVGFGGGRDPEHPSIERRIITIEDGPLGWRTVKGDARFEFGNPLREGWWLKPDSRDADVAIDYPISAVMTFRVPDMPPAFEAVQQVVVEAYDPAGFMESRRFDLDDVRWWLQLRKPQHWPCARTMDVDTILSKRYEKELPILFCYCITDAMASAEDACRVRLRWLHGPTGAELNCFLMSDGLPIGMIEHKFNQASA